MQVAANGMRVSYEEHGSGPAVLVLHGSPIDWGLWKRHIQPPALGGYRIIVPEFRGCGESSAPAADCSDDVIGLLNRLGIGRAAVIGLSLCGPVLNTLLERYPHRLAAAVLLEPRIRMGGETESGSLMDLVSKRRVDGGLLDFLNGVKRLKPLCQSYRQVA